MSILYVDIFLGSFSTLSLMHSLAPTNLVECSSAPDSLSAPSFIERLAGPFERQLALRKSTLPMSTLSFYTPIYALLALYTMKTFLQAAL
jgi:hypothetical protein